MPRGRPRISDEALEQIGVKLEHSTARALEEWALKNDFTTEDGTPNLSAAARACITRVVTGEEPTKATGYQDGVRRGLQEARGAIQKAVAGLWRK